MCGCATPMGSGVDTACRVPTFWGVVYDFLLLIIVKVTTFGVVGIFLGMIFYLNKKKVVSLQKSLIFITSKFICYGKFI